MNCLGALLIIAVVMTGAALALEPFVFGNNKVSFVLPDKFSRMPKEVVDQKYPRGTAPEYVFSNAKTTVSIAAGYKPGADLSIAELPQFKEYIEKTFERNVAGLRWITREITEINGRRWIHLEFQSNAFDTEIINSVFMTALDNGLVTLNFNATVGDYPGYKATLQQSQRSIRVKE
jgi:hypothetical protein